MVRLLPRLGRRTSKTLQPCEAKPCDAAPCLWAATVDELEGELARRRSEDDYAALAFESFKDDRIVLAVAQLREARARGWRGEAPAIEACERYVCAPPMYSSTVVLAQQRCTMSLLRKATCSANGIADRPVTSVAEQHLRWLQQCALMVCFSCVSISF